MKTTLRPALAPVAILALLALAEPAAAGRADWWAVQATEARIEFVDASTVTDGAVRSAWSKAVYAPDEAVKEGAAFELVQQDYDCSARATRLRRIVEYRADGGVKETFDWPAAENMWRPAAPESVAGAKLAFVCGAPDARKDLDVRHVGADVTAYVDDWFTASDAGQAI
jgi:hypothetical protein